MTALMCASMEGHAAVVEVLLEHDALAEFKDPVVWIA